MLETIIIIGVGIVWVFLIFLPAKEKRMPDGSLRYTPPLLSGVAISFVLLVAAALFALITLSAFGDGVEKWAVWDGVCLLLVSLIGVLVIMMEHLLYYVEYGADELRHRNWRGKKTVVRYRDINKLTANYNTTGQGIPLRAGMNVVTRNGVVLTIGRKFPIEPLLKNVPKRRQEV